MAWVSALEVINPGLGIFALDVKLSWPRILYQAENQDSLFVVFLGVACLLRLVNWLFASLVSYFPVLFLVILGL